MVAAVTPKFRIVTTIRACISTLVFFSVDMKLLAWSNEASSLVKFFGEISESSKRRTECKNTSTYASI